MAGYILYATPDEEKDRKIAELEAQAKKEEDDLEEEYSRLGEAYFEQNRLCSNVPAEFRELFDAIKEKKVAIKQCKEKIMTLKKVKVCPYCNSEIPEESVFCIMCGKKVQRIQLQKVENTVTCTFCGTVLPAGSKFCGYCAHSLVGETVEENTLLENINAVGVEDKYKSEEYESEEYADEESESEEYESEEYADEESESEEYKTDEAEDEEDLYATVAANTGWNAVKICPRCSKKLDRSSRFCTGCGMRL